MSQKKDNRMIVFSVAAGVLILGGIILGVVMSSQEGSNGDGVAKLAIDSSRYDFGTISMSDGLATHTFKITNDGTADLKLSKISTSCMCTSAILEVDGDRSPKFGMHNNPAFWSEKIKPGQSADLEVTFDPNAHGPNATGPVTRTVTFYSNDNGQSSVKSSFTFTANVIK